MNAAWWISTLVLAPLLGYELQFTAATLKFGRWLSDTNTGIGFQAAITPPWSNWFGYPIYAFTLTLVGMSWYHFGLGRALLTVVILYFGLSFAQRLLPGPDSLHFKAHIIQSMAARYANFVRRGDEIRANAMGLLLLKAGIEPTLLAGHATSAGMSAATQANVQPDARK
jgi:hypothetical protein